jgi:hypothetical protein
MLRLRGIGRDVLDREIGGDAMTLFIEAHWAKTPMNENSLEIQIEELLRQASEYATQSIASMVEQLEEDYGTPNKLFYDYVRLMHGLEVHFLFPGLGDSDRDLVVALLSARSAMIMGMNKVTASPPGDARQELEAVITHLKNRFQDLRGQILSHGLLERLTSLQRRIIEERFLTQPQ